MGSLDVASLPSRDRFTPHCSKIVAEVKALQSPHV